MSGDESLQKHMDGIYRHQRHIYDLTRKFCLLGRDQLLDDMRPPAGGTVLEVGCGSGRNLILTARQYPEARLYGLDISPLMLETARHNISRLGFSDRITVVEGDAAHFSSVELFGAPCFDRVFISYAVSMIPPWQVALAQAYKGVRPGGSLHVVDFGQQEALPLWFKRGLDAWLKKFSVTSRETLQSEMCNVAAIDDGVVRFERLFRDYAHYGVIKKPPA